MNSVCGGADCSIRKECANWDMNYRGREMATYLDWSKMGAGGCCYNPIAGEMEFQESWYCGDKSKNYKRFKPLHRVAVALTGHRPQRLGYSENIKHPDWYKVLDWMKSEILECRVTDVYSGMAAGCDIAFAMAAIELKKSGYQIKLHCILPCKNYQNNHEWFYYIKNRADEWIELSEKYYKGCDNVRDQYMVDNADLLFAVWDWNESGGVWSTIRKAQRKGMDIIYYPKEKL